MTGRRLILAETALSLARPFGTAVGTVGTRRTILVGIDDGSSIGWGEAAPYPGVTNDTIETVAVDLARAAEVILAGGHPPSLSATAGAAVDEARMDLAARLAGRPLWVHLGGSGAGVDACAAVGMAASPDDLLEAVSTLAESGYRAVKLKIEPGRDIAPLEAVIGAFPEMVVGVDANGSYDDPDDPVLRAVAEIASYIEQPFASGDFASHRNLRGPDVTVVLDESIDSPAAAAEAIDAEAADVVTVKPGRLGIDGCLRIMALAATAGIGIKASSLLESAVGRAHTLAVATMPGVVLADIASSDRYFESDPWAGALRFGDGKVTAPDSPGIGIDVDTEDAATVRMIEA